MVMFYVLLMGFTYLFNGTIIITDIFNTLFGTAFCFFITGWFKGDPLLASFEPLVRIGKYVVFIIIIVILAILMFCFKVFSMSIIQFLGCIITMPLAYYLVDTAFDEPAQLIE
jgi:hypothetical protein